MITVDSPVCRDVVMPIAGPAVAVGMITGDSPARRDVVMPIAGPAVALGMITGDSPGQPASSPTRQAAGALRSSSSCTNVRTAAPVPPCGV